MSENNVNDNKIKDRKNWLEWTIFGLGLVLVLAIVSYLGYQAYFQKRVTPILETAKFHDPSEEAPNRYRVLLKNKGGQTAEEVNIEVNLIRNGQEIEKAELGFPFAPQESQREGWVNFRSKPTPQDSIEVHVMSYKKP